MFEELGVATRECFAQARILDPLTEVQVLELYDPFSSMLFPSVEAMGFCSPGRAAGMSDDGVFDVGGQVVVSPSGGTLCTNPIGVTGLVRVVDAAMQVMGKAGAMQVPNVRRAVATAAGGSAQFFAVTALGKEPV
jgi:acetyl-CoA C-acetyltransferase